jgi:hypothetical protein
MKKFKTLFKYDRKKELLSSNLNQALNFDDVALKISDICLKRFHKKKVFRHKTVKKLCENASFSHHSILNSDSSLERKLEKSHYSESDCGL